MKNSQNILILITISLLNLSCTSDSLLIHTELLEMQLSAEGTITSLRVGSKNCKAIFGQTELEGCALYGQVSHRKIQHGGIEFTKTLRRLQDSRTLLLSERFVPVHGSVRWEIEITDEQKPWNTAIKTILKYPVGKQTKFWTAWADPRLPDKPEPADQWTHSAYILDKIKNNEWADPLVPQTMKTATLYYGAPYYRYDEPNLFFIPFLRDLFCIPLVTFLEEQDDDGLSLILSPEDRIFDLTMTTTPDGQVTFTRLFNRIGEGKTVRFAMNLVAHQADWREALGWTVNRYDSFFRPAVSRAQEISGTGAYSSRWIDFDAEKMRAMAFMVNWKASFDFPYMGMFLPPLHKDAEEWTSFQGEKVSIDRMRQYSIGMHQLGFHVLNYFNVYEFGAHIQFPQPQRGGRLEADLWKDANDFLYGKLGHAMVRVPEREKALDSPLYQNKVGGPYTSWRGCVLLDPGEPGYEDFLLEQARRHIEKLPESSGICIDRLDWCRLYNHSADDGQSWYDGKAVRSLVVSWKQIAEKLGTLMHAADKAVFVNNHVKRIDLLKDIDGIFDEFTYHGCPLNLTALLCVERPALGWTSVQENLGSDPDFFFQKYLYLGVFPMAPFPGNDHSLQPGAWVDKQYLDYGPLMTAMRGRRWVLEPHILQVLDADAKANIFRVSSGFVIPVVFAKKDSVVKIAVCNLKSLTSGNSFKAEALHPGSDTWVPVALADEGNTLRIQVPVRRGCAMVRLDEK